MIGCVRVPAVRQLTARLSISASHRIRMATRARLLHSTVNAINIRSPVRPLIWPVTPVLPVYGAQHAHRLHPLSLHQERHLQTRSQSRLAGKNVLITGASAGIGEACAKEFASAGANLILTARRLDRLDTIRQSIQKSHPDTNIHCARLDVRDVGAVSSFTQSIPSALRNVDILVNNAGLVLGLDRTEDVSPENVDIMLDTNVKGVLNMLRAIIPGMRERNSGHVVNIGSIAGIEAYMGGSVYCAAKHAVNAITQALRHEVMDTPIRVSEIKPGMVETEFSVVRFGGDKSRADKVYEGMTPLTGQDIAELVVFTVSRPQHVQIADILVLSTDQAAATRCHRRPVH